MFGFRVFGVACFFSFLFTMKWSGVNVVACVAEESLWDVCIHTVDYDMYNN